MTNKETGLALGYSRQWVAQLKANENEMYEQIKSIGNGSFFDGANNLSDEFNELLEFALNYSYYLREKSGSKAIDMLNPLGEKKRYNRDFSNKFMLMIRQSNRKTFRTKLTQIDDLKLIHRHYQNDEKYLQWLNNL